MPGRLRPSPFKRMDAVRIPSARRTRNPTTHSAVSGRARSRAWSRALTAPDDGCRWPPSHPNCGRSLPASPAGDAPARRLPHWTGAGPRSRRDGCRTFIRGTEPWIPLAPFPRSAGYRRFLRGTEPWTPLAPVPAQRRMSSASRSPSRARSVRGAAGCARDLLAAGRPGGSCCGSVRSIACDRWPRTSSRSSRSGCRRWRARRRSARCGGGRPACDRDATAWSAGGVPVAGNAR